jgi:hypothetical protein
VAPCHERLVDLVGDRVCRTEEHRERLALDRPHEQRPEHRVLGHVRELSQDEIPGAEARAEAGDRREREDQAGPQDDGQPQVETRRGHGIPA